MAKDIIIQDEYYRANHMSGVTRLRTELEDGGVCYWIPEDEAVALTEKTITENGIYRAVTDDVSGYSTVTVNIENSYSEYDEGRVISGGVLVDQTSRIITTNGTYDTTTNNSISVETSSNLKSKSITVNGSYNASSDDADGYSAVTVNVPNTYTQTDEGKVVNNSQLVNQTSRTITVNGTYDTTLNDSVTVETSSNLIAKTITSNGLYSASSDDVDGYSEVIVNVAGGSDIDAKALIEGGLTKMDSADIKKVKNYAFYGQNSLSFVNIPEMLEVGWYAFANCNSITEISFPKCETIGDGAFSSCTSLLTVYAPMATSIGGGAFRKCVSLLSCDIQSADMLHQGVFESCYTLMTVNIPSVSTISAAAFRYCSSIKKIDGENVKSIAGLAFSGCTDLSSVSFPKLESFAGNTFAGLSALSTVNLGSVISTITGAAFRSCINLTSLYILTNSVCSLESGAAFNTTPMSPDYSTDIFGLIYVPSNLVSAYKSAARWSYYSDHITAYTE